MTTPAPRNRFEANPRKTKWLVAFLCLAFLEGVCRILVGMDLLPYREYPTSRKPQYWGYVDPVVGMWHLPNTTFRQKEKCLDALHETNADGMRDPERQAQSTAQRRFVVLGDSFIEGYGINAGDRVSNLLETATGFEFLNFGTSGGFGTIQEWLLYKSRALKYDHTDVVLFITPANDFEDDDPAEFAADVYRPFLRPKGDGYEVYYRVAWERRFTDIRSLGTSLKNRFDNTFYLANALRWATSELKSGFRKRRVAAARADYDDYSADDLKIMEYALDQLVRAAGGRQVWLLTIPTENDFVATLRGDKIRLPGELASFAARYPNVHYLDLLPVFLEDARANGRQFPDYLIACDKHWGLLGNKLVADHLRSWLLGPAS